MTALAAVESAFIASADAGFAHVRREVVLGKLREEAFHRFLRAGLPTTREEDWKYTSLRPIAETEFTFGRQAIPLSKDELAPYSLADGDISELVFVNGVFSQELSRVRPFVGIRCESLADAISSESSSVSETIEAYYRSHPDAFTALNTAFFADGTFVEIERGAVIETPIHILHVCKAGERPLAVFPRVIVKANAGSQAAIIESFVALGGTSTLIVPATQSYIEEGAILNHTRLQLGSESAFHMARYDVIQERDSNCTTAAVTIGGSIVRNDTGAVLNGEGAECTLNGLYVCRGRQHVDNHTTLDHAKAHCNSFEYYKGILDEAAAGVFSGKIIVRADAQKTDSKQSNMNLLLSDDALINTKPQLEIFADDVRCTHGATIGRLDENAVFYLRTRGIGESSARRLLTYAFASEIIELTPYQPLRVKLEAWLFERFAEPTATGHDDANQI